MEDDRDAGGLNPGEAAWVSHCVSIRLHRIWVDFRRKRGLSAEIIDLAAYRNGVRPGLGPRKPSSSD